MKPKRSYPYSAVGPRTWYPQICVTALFALSLFVQILDIGVKVNIISTHSKLLSLTVRKGCYQKLNTIRVQLNSWEVLSSPSCRVDNPWSQVSPLLPPPVLILFFIPNRVQFSVFTTRRTFAEFCELPLPHFRRPNKTQKKYLVKK